MSSPPLALLEKTDQQIRTRLLTKLGIYDTPASTGMVEDKSSSSCLFRSAPLSAAQQRRLRILRGMGVGYSITPSPPDGSARRRPLNETARVFHEPLKGGEEYTPSSLVDSSVSGAYQRRQRRISFENKVEVVPIPTRNEYSDRIKSRIWSNRSELQENAQRNAIEFASEGWDWRQVTEDSGMYICSVSGELVHPIHLQQIIVQEQQENSSLASDELMEDASNNTPSLQRGKPAHM